VEKVAHNFMWSLSGVILFTCMENVVAYLWASGRLDYLSDDDTFSTPVGWVKFILALFLMPAYRAVHFYVVHRMLHFPPLYYFVHSLHHRNTDIEPFSGTCMHPVEHLYYFSSYLGSLIFVCSPFAFYWNGVHLLLSPAASHSGWEDHFQSDPFHYMHHRYFECNYSSSDAMFVDEFFGTCINTMAQKDKSGITLRDDAKSTLRGVPSVGFVTYILLVLGCLYVFVDQASRVYSGVVLSQSMAVFYSLVGGVGPVAVAVVMWIMIRSPSNNSLGMTGPWKFVHLSMAFAINVFPVIYTCYLALRPL